MSNHSTPAAAKIEYGSEALDVDIPVSEDPCYCLGVRYTAMVEVVSIDGAGDLRT